jgi:hypothetical protein
MVRGVRSDGTAGLEQFEPAWRGALRYADAVTADGNGVSDELYAALAADVAGRAGLVADPISAPRPPWRQGGRQTTIHKSRKVAEGRGGGAGDARRPRHLKVGAGDVAPAKSVAEHGP